MNFRLNVSGFKDIKLLSHGLWSRRTIHRFHSQNSVADTEIQVTTIDETLKGGSLTFIKMDIGRAEQPKQAVCVYHKPLEIVEIPFYLKEPVPEYFQDTIMILVMKRFYML
jgi:hypothetical protein